MRILLLTHAFNSLTQRLFVVLQQDGHEVSIEFDIHDNITQEAIDLFQPELIIAPYLKRAIPESIWSTYICLIVHPGIMGDRGSSSLDWAIMNQEKTWGVTVLQANATMDSGDIWASVSFPMRHATKASLYRNEVTSSAIQAVHLAMHNHQQAVPPRPLNPQDADILGICRPTMQQQHRRIDWHHDDALSIVRHINAADGFPGVKDHLYGKEVLLFDAHIAKNLHGASGSIIAKSGHAICRATHDGAVWLGHLKDKQHEHPFKLPATHLLAQESHDLPEIPPKDGYRDIYYEEDGAVGYLHFPFYNGAMSTQQCQRLLFAFNEATQQPTKLLVFMGGSDFWSNGIHLNMIEVAKSPADESWYNINAMNDLSQAMIQTTSHIIIAAMQGNAGAGGVFLARAADEVWAHHSIILNPHYKDMGNLYGSEYWTYLLPKYCGHPHAQRITQARLPMGTHEAHHLGLIDHVIEGEKKNFLQQVQTRTQHMLAHTHISHYLQRKKQQRQQDETHKALASYREEELSRMKKNFYGFDPSYHVARYNFVYKVCKSRTPLTLATHRNNKRHAKRSTQ